MIDTVVQGLARGGFKISQFEFSVNAQKPGSDLLIQLTRDERYQPFVTRAETREVLGCRIPVASLPDLIQGKIWAWQDPRRRLSKRTKDQADLLRIGENHPALLHLLPDGLRQQLQEERWSQWFNYDSPLALGRSSPLLFRVMGSHWNAEDRSQN